MRARSESSRPPTTALAVTVNGPTGDEIPVNRHFYVFEPPRELAEIDADLKQVSDRIKVTIEGLQACGTASGCGSQ